MSPTSTTHLFVPPPASTLSSFVLSATLRKSSPLEPFSVSSPKSPNSRSLPPLPFIVSLPPPPAILSLLELPLIVPLLLAPVKAPDTDPPSPPPVPSTSTTAITVTRRIALRILQTPFLGVTREQLPRPISAY